MLEQHTMRMGLDVVQQYGPVGALAIWLLFYTITSGWRLKKSAVNPLKNVNEEINKLREAKGILHERINEIEIKTLKEMSNLKVLLEKRATYEWIEKTLMPEVKDIEEKISQNGERLSRIEAKLP